MASRALWSPEELAVIEACAPGCDVARACKDIQGRTRKAIKVRMAKFRASVGFGDGRNERSGGDYEADDDRWVKSAVIASQTLLAATLRVGVWS